MTIGIAASGPGAARAIVTALASIESVASGAVGGFISLACIGPAGLWRCGHQRDGARGLLAEMSAAGLPDATRAVLMSSGPDRPEPLSQFTPAEAATGLVTGHRFPNAPGPEGTSYAEMVLARMRNGMPPAEAARSVADEHPRADAGFISLGIDGRIGIANTAYVAGFPGLGRAELEAEGARVAVLCNAITHGNLLASLAAEMVLASMAPPKEVRELTLSAGIPVLGGEHAELRLDRDLKPAGLCLPALDDPMPRWFGGYGPDALVSQAGKPIGRLLDEPFLVGADGKVESFNGMARVTVRYAVRRG